MRYLLILLIILGFASCQNKAAEFVNSVDIVEQNKLLLERGMKAKQDIQKIREARDEGDGSVEDGGRRMDDGQKISNSQFLSASWRTNKIPNSKLQATNTTSDSNNSSTSSIKPQASPLTLAIPTTFDLPVKFASQAPFAVWDELHKEACEEAAMITAAKYLKGENLDELTMEDEIQELVKWETEQGYKIDLTIIEATEILKDYFGLRAEVTSEVTIERIKRELARGNLVITPHAGRELGNPYYRQPGPVYHFLVIRGWDEDEFITNDVGTKRGKGYKYKFNKLIETVHDWNGGNVETGERVMIVVYR